ncbi:leucine-rich repeat extensin-like protein 6 isoform X2 [Benincasa hispida]|uniref:leucine-rich repeat extensin-like protein 6 isoform X2 n=1 Tax=Benincasa hispida TaxID=102211 RepID=UPI0018FFBD56|nr:leucine-rich repeat extensin-like protein 6 isoform X2 [Benincasa hispida]
MAFWGGTQRQTRQLLEVTVDRCYNLEDTEPFATEYSCVLEYGDSTRRTRPCFGRGTHPVFEEKFVFEFTERVIELNIWVLANKPPRNDEVIGSLRVQLQQLPSDGYVESTWTLQKTDGRPAGYIRLTLQFPTSSCRLERQDSYYPAPRLDSTAPLEAVATQRPILYQLLPYDAAPPPRPIQPNGTGPTTLWSQLLPYGALPPSSPTQPNSTRPAALWSQFRPYGSPPSAPPAGYPLSQYPIHPPPPPGSGPSGIYPPPPR